MAIDTRDKRASLMASGIDAHLVLPTPGTHTQGDRQQVAGSYRGILAGILMIMYGSGGGVARKVKREEESSRSRPVDTSRKRPGWTSGRRG